jgi:hypothetical protein
MAAEIYTQSPSEHVPDLFVRRLSAPGNGRCVKIKSASGFCESNIPKARIWLRPSVPPWAKESSLWALFLERWDS